MAKKSGGVVIKEMTNKVLFIPYVFSSDCLNLFLQLLYQFSDLDFTLEVKPDFELEPRK